MAFTIKYLGFPAIFPWNQSNETSSLTFDLCTTSPERPECHCARCAGPFQPHRCKQHTSCPAQRALLGDLGLFQCPKWRMSRSKYLRHRSVCTWVQGKSDPETIGFSQISSYEDLSGTSSERLQLGANVASYSSAIVAWCHDDIWWLHFFIFSQSSKEPRAHIKSRGSGIKTDQFNLIYQLLSRSCPLQEVHLRTGAQQVHLHLLVFRGGVPQLEGLQTMDFHPPYLPHFRFQDLSLSRWRKSHFLHQEHEATSSHWSLWVGRNKTNAL